MRDEPTGLSEDEVWDALEELHGEGAIEHVPGIGSDVDPAFRMTDEGLNQSEELLKDNDEALLFLLGLIMQDSIDDGQKPAEALDNVAEWIKENVGVNALRVMKRNHERIDWFDAEGLPEELLEEYDP